MAAINRDVTVAASVLHSRIRATKRSIVLGYIQWDATHKSGQSHGSGAMEPPEHVDARSGADGLFDKAYNEVLWGLSEKLQMELRLRYLSILVLISTVSLVDDHQ